MLQSKVISFSGQKNNDFILNSSYDVGAVKDILWPCYCYTASIPYRGKSRLNVFEETILGLTECETSDPDKLADISCLNKDVIVFIQNRLSLKGFLKPDYQITDLGRQVLAKKEDDQDESRSFASVKIFVDALNNEVLPYVHKGKFESKKILSVDGKIVKFMSKVTDKKCIKAYIIEKKNKRDLFIPKEHHVIRAIAAFKNRFYRYAAITGNDADEPPYIPKESGIFINKESEKVFLHCRAFIQESDTDVLIVTDGFGYGFSSKFAEYLENNIPKLKDALKNDAAGKELIDIDKKSEVYNKNVHPVVFLINKSKNILKTETAVRKGKATEKNIKFERAKAFTFFYDALEKTFVQVTQEYPVPKWIKIFESQPYQENNKILAAFAEKIGLIIDDKNKNILKVNTGAIRVLNINNPDLTSSLAILITGAANNANHPFNKLADNFPEILSILSEILSIRNPTYHGKIDSNKYYKEINEHLNTVEKIIMVLLPGIASQFITQSEIKGNILDTELINQQRLNASRELEKYFNISIIQRFDTNLKELLISITTLNNDMDASSIQWGINNLSSALQIVYYDAIMSADLLKADTKGTMKIKNIAFEKAVRSKFITNKNEIPESISSVPENKLKRIISEGKEYSLQVNFIVFLFLCNYDILYSIREKCPDLLHLTGILTDRRKHGCMDFSVFENKEKSIENFMKLRENVFKAIKAIMEVL